MTKLYVFCDSEFTPKWWARRYFAYMRKNARFIEDQNKVKVNMYDEHNELIDILSVVFVRYSSSKDMLNRIFGLRSKHSNDILYFVWEDKTGSTAGRDVMHLASRINELYFMGKRSKNHGYNRNQTEEKEKIRDRYGRVFFEADLKNGGHTLYQDTDGTYRKEGIRTHKELGRDAESYRGDSETG